MIKIYDGSVFALDINAYDRKQILNQCWLNSKCSELRFLVYDGEELIGAMSYQDILADKRVVPNCQCFGEDLFARAREYFRREENRQSCIPVQSDRGELMFLLYFVENRIWSGGKDGTLFHEYWEIDFDSYMESLDFTLLESASGFYFFKLEEYTYEIARLIQKKYPEKKICFADKMAEKFFPQGHVQIYESTWELNRKEHPAGYLYVNSKRDQTEYWASIPYLTGHYGSIQLMESLMWCQKRKRMGDKNEGQTIFLMDFSTDYHGLVDILRYGFIWIMIARIRGWVPVVKLDCFPNQYLIEAGENMWEYFFMPVSGLSVEEAMQSADVISASENGLHLGDDFIVNPYFREISDMVAAEAEYYSGKHFNEVVRKNEMLEDYLNEWLLPEFRLPGNRILGVVARGTDFKKEILEKARGKKIDYEKDVSILQIIKRSRECAGIWNCNYVFVATEDEEYFQAFSDEFGEALLFVGQKRLTLDCNDDVCYISDKLNLKKEEKKTFALSYLLAIYCLSKCDVLITSRKHCGADLLAKLWKEGEFEHTETIR